MITLIARLLATAVHEVVTEYRRLESQGADEQQEVSCTSLTTETRYQQDAEVPASPFGFGKPAR